MATHVQKRNEGDKPPCAPLFRSSSMTTGASPGSSRITLLGIAFIWMTAQVLVVVVHDFWISRGG
jgi:hypothetical protein